jgi:two-component system chemotaxis response regulator CheB
MGQDGLNGCRALREAGARVLVQDEASSIVWGMPGYVVRAGLADAVVPLDRIAAELTKIVAEGRSPEGASRERLLAGAGMKGSNP